MRAIRIGESAIETNWRGEVTWRQTPALRDSLLALLDRPEGFSLLVDVREVTVVDHAGVGVLVAAKRRAALLGRGFGIIDSGGPVSRTLRRTHLLDYFEVTQVLASVPVARES